jgi:hypothetical protein
VPTAAHRIIQLIDLGYFDSFLLDVFKGVNCR